MRKQRVALEHHVHRPPIRRHAGDDPAPSSRMRPSSGVSKPASMRSSVVLPQPEGPSSAKNSPFENIERELVDRDNGAEAFGDPLEAHQRAAASRAAAANRPRLDCPPPAGHANRGGPALPQALSLSGNMLNGRGRRRVACTGCGQPPAPVQHGSTGSRTLARAGSQDRHDPVVQRLGRHRLEKSLAPSHERLDHPPASPWPLSMRIGTSGIGNTPVERDRAHEFRTVDVRHLPIDDDDIRIVRPGQPQDPPHHRGLRRWSSRRASRASPARPCAWIASSSTTSTLRASMRGCNSLVRAVSMTSISLHGTRRPPRPGTDINHNAIVAA